jgi:hypothetical protein
VVDPLLQAQFDDARARYDDASAELERLAIRMAMDSLAEVLPTAASVVAFGEVDEDGIWRLRTQRVLAGDGSVLFDVDAGHADRSVEDAVDNVDVELLDVLIDLRPDAYSGHVELGS